MLDWIPGWEATARVGAAVVLGALVGAEREVRDNPAGLRTHAAVALGASLFGVISTLGFDEHVRSAGRTNVQVDVTRVASQVVVGVGFLGAGLIFRRGGSVRNLTTAATLWATAAIGLAAGVGDPGLAAVSTLGLLVVLAVAPAPQRWIVRAAGRNRRRVLVTLAPGVEIEQLRAAVEASGPVEIDRWRVENHGGQLVVDLRVATRAADDIDAAVASVARSTLVADLRAPP